MLPPFSYFAAVKCDSDSHVSFRTGEVDVANDKRLWLQIDDEVRLVGGQAGGITVVLQKSGLAGVEECGPSVLDHSQLAGTEYVGVRSGGLFSWLGYERGKLKLEATAIIGEGGVALVGGNDEGAADWLV